MSKKSSYTDQTQPPYFRLDAQQYKSYSVRAEQRVKDLIAAAPSGMAYTSAAICGKALTRAVAHQPDPDPPAYYDPDAELDDDFDDEAQPPTDRYHQFRKLTVGWTGNDTLNIGPIRTLYYFDLFASDAYNDDVMDGGGFPRSPHATIPRRISPFGDLLHPPDHGQDWLIYDLFLSDALAGLGLAWKTIEKAMTDAFLAALPPVYPPLLTAADVPRPLAFLLWRHDLEHWRFFRVHGQAIQREAAKMSRMLWKTPDGPEFAPMLASLARRAEPAPWTQPARGAEKLAEELQECCKDSTPVIKAVNKALYVALWNGMTTEAIRADVPDFLRHIHNKRVEDEERADEYWMLMADILYHLPIVRGLPPLRRFRDAPPRQFPAQSFTAVRISVTRNSDEKVMPDKAAATRGKTRASEAPIRVLKQPPK